MLSNLQDKVCILSSATDFLYNHKQATYTSVCWLYSNSNQLHKRKQGTGFVHHVLSLVHIMRRHSSVWKAELLTKAPLKIILPFLYAML